ncbi:MAG: ArsC/Spx/MgsR family protein [Methylococcales bacterium]
MGWQYLLNRSSTSWRQLSPEQQSQLIAIQTQSGPLCADNNAVLIILNTPTLLKRPILDCDGQLLIGFNADRYQEHFLQ